MPKQRLELAAVLSDRGHQYLTASSLALMVEEAVKRCVYSEAWPFRVLSSPLTTATGLPVSGAPLGVIKEVYEIPPTGYRKRYEPITQEELFQAQIAPPSVSNYYYVDRSAAVRAIKFDGALPTGQVFARHISMACWVGGGTPAINASGDSDIPLWPETHYEVLIAAARKSAYEDIDDYEAAAQQEGKFQTLMDEARPELMRDENDEAGYVRQTQELI